MYRSYLSNSKPAKADDLEQLLLAYLNSVDAEKAEDFRPKRKKKANRK